MTDWTDPVVQARRAQEEARASLTPAEKQRLWREANPEKHAANRKRAYAAKYGLTPEQLDSKFAEQNGQCAICKIDIELNTANGMHVDHDHYNDAVRGLLCGPCNVGIGMLQDSAGLMRRAADYIDFWSIVHQEETEDA